MSEKEESIRIEYVDDNLDCQIARILCPEATYGDTIRVGIKRYEAMKAMIEKRERAAWEAARTYGTTTRIKITRSDGAVEEGEGKDFLRLRYSTFDDWKKEQEK